MKIDLEALSLEELKELQKDVAKAITNFESRKRKEALAVVEAKAAEMGFNLSDLLGETKGKGQKSPPKYAHPENASVTWTGRGRQPGWVKEALAAGQSLDDLLIAK